MKMIRSKLEGWRKNLQKTIESNPWVVSASLAFVTAAMAVQLFIKINRFAVNILFSDQWDTYQPIFNGDNAWRIFTAQVGQLRLGVGGLLSATVAEATSWNTRAESFFIGLTMVLIAIAALYLKRRLFGEITLWDALIPMICLSVTLTDVPIFVPFPSHSTVPVLLLLVYAVCLTFENFRIRFASLAIINFLAVFTGWGIFIGFITPFLLIYLIFFRVTVAQKQEKIWATSVLAASIFSLGFYFYDYIVFTGVECFKLPHYPLYEYLTFASLMLSNSVGFACGRAMIFAKILGTLLILISAFVLFKNLWKLLRDKEADTKNLVIVVFLSFSALFVLSSTVGRVCLGECSAAAGRYQPLLIPAWLGIYFAVIMLKEQKIRLIFSLLLLLFCFIIPESKSKSYQGSAEYSRNFKIQWKTCYLETEDAGRCDKEVGTSIFSPIPSSKAQDRIDYLKQRHLNFFADK